MPLPSPANRVQQHTRRVVCEGYKREDGLWDIEGHLLDTKNMPIELKDRDEGILPAGEPVHSMAIRLTIDLDLNILDVAASMDATPFKGCPSIADSYKRLIGVQIKPGFTKLTREMFGGVNGCTHLLELLGPVATTAYQATHHEREIQEGWTDGDQKPPMLDMCHTMDSKGGVVQQYWPHFYQSKKSSSPLEVIASSANESKHADPASEH
ncbi:DUF2889 domain-containing protein [Pontibacterium granulatum]|uniref:DUF2889 domain-containing protein n=1 Tax=Pontibacterium granulatum TaxID=2036029 RepID=UPI00249BE948|nr:DUF2889 domain-containing protein [Pontibacterium granulatum]MDI3326707.1 DUF2889 domain-containing protein [Pontibacterium granulatum]